MTKQRTMLTYETIKEHLRSDLAEVQGELSSPILFGHVCKGDLTRPGALRCSAIRSTPACAATQDVDMAALSPDERVFQEHIEMAGRDQTFLDWVSLWALGATASNGPASRVPLQSCVACKVISSDAPMTLTVSQRDCTLGLSTALVDELAPQELVTSYLDRLYEWAEGFPVGRWEPADMEWVHDRLRAAQVQGVLSCLKHKGSMEAARSLTLPYAKSTPSPTGTETDEQPALLRRFLGSLQFALLYLRRHYEGALLQSGFVSLAIVALEADIGDDKSGADVSRWRSPVAVMSVPFNREHDAAQVAQTVLRKLTSGSLRSILHDLHKHPLEIADSTSCEIQNSAVRQRMRDAVLAAFPGPAFGDWPIESALWMAELARLSLKFKHEGKRLSFTFVLGDATQMVDSGHFECVPLMSRDFQYPPGKTFDVIDIDEIALMVRRELADENYCWFLGGRYALMWDATFPSLHPTHLIRLRDSSWELFAAACRSGKAPTSAKYAVVVSYSMGGVGGGLVVDGRHAFVLTKDEQWQVRGAEFESRVREYLDATEVAMHDGQKERLSQALSAVSADPDRGCILVVSTSRVTPTFELMGRPWQIDRRGGRGVLSTDHTYELDNIEVDELVALLAMDGAGVVWLDQHGKTRIAFRQLVSAPHPAKRALSDEARRSLIGKGSRRWSASLVATKDDVPLVVAVSQDGPVYVASSRTIHNRVLAEFNGGLPPGLGEKVDVIQIDDPGAVAAWRKQTKVTGARETAL